MEIEIVPSFIQDILKLVSGTVVALLIALLAMPVITRLYSPEDFGILQLFISILSIICLISCLQYQLSILLPKKDEDAANIFALCIVLITVSSILCWLIVSMSSKWIGIVLNAPKLSNYLIFLPLAFFLNSIFIVMNYWLSRKSRFGRIASSGVANSLSSKAVQIRYGIDNANSQGLISGVIFGYIIQDLIMLRAVSMDSSLLKSINYKKVLQMAARYRNFPLFSAWSEIANDISRQSPSFMLSLFYSTAVVGYYSMAVQIVSLPMSIIGSATGQVFLKNASEERNKPGGIRNIVMQTHRKLVCTMIFPMVILLIIGEELFGFVLGPKWYISGLYVKLLVPWIFLMFISSPLTNVFFVLEKQSYALVFDVVLLVSRVGALYLGGVYGDPYFTLALFSLTGALFCGLMNLIILKLSNVDIREEIIIDTRFLLLSILASIPVFIAKSLGLNIYALLILSIIMGVIYYGVVVLSDPSLKGLIPKAIGRIIRFV
jgi:lipopolysaccharide exporter